MVKKATTFATILLFSTAPFLTGCARIAGAFFASVQGSGHVVSEERSVAKFHEIHLQTSADVEVTQGPTTSISIEAEDNILPLIHTDVKENALVITNEQNVLTSKGITIRITTPDLSAVVIDGSGSVKTLTPFSGKTFTALVAGCGDLDADLSYDQIKTSIDGSGDMTLRGKTQDYHGEISGAGSIHALDLQAETGSVDISGSGDGEVNCARALKAEVSGSGDILYRGDPPSLHTSISGSGSISKKVN